jgi:hypothetical protein
MKQHFVNSFIVEINTKCLVKKQAEPRARRDLINLRQDCGGQRFPKSRHQSLPIHYGHHKIPQR